jgi:hypothetical protein
MSRRKYGSSRKLPAAIEARKSAFVALINLRPCAWCWPGRSNSPVKHAQQLVLTSRLPTSSRKRAAVSRFEAADAQSGPVNAPGSAPFGLHQLIDNAPALILMKGRSRRAVGCTISASFSLPQPLGPVIGTGTSAGRR